MTKKSKLVSTKKLKVDRLQTLVKYLKSLDLNQVPYNQASWSKCAFFHASDIEEFNKLGYKPYPNVWYDKFSDSDVYRGVSYKGEYYEQAVAKFFGLSEGVANWLSIYDYKGDTDATPKEFIRRVNAFIDGRVIEDEGGYEVITKAKRDAMLAA